MWVGTRGVIIKTKPLRLLSLKVDSDTLLTVEIIIISTRTMNHCPLQSAKLEVHRHALLVRQLVYTNRFSFCINF